MRSFRQRFSIILGICVWVIAGTGCLKVNNSGPKEEKQLLRKPVPRPGKWIYTANYGSSDVTFSWIPNGTYDIEVIKSYPAEPKTFRIAAAWNKFLYATNPNSQSISIFAIDQISGELEFNSHFSSPGYPNAIVFKEDIGVLYVAHYNANLIRSYLVDPQTGALSLLQQIGVGVNRPVFLKLSDGDARLFVVNQASGTVMTLNLDSLGGMTASPLGPQAVGPAPSAFVFDRTESYAYFNLFSAEAVAFLDYDSSSTLFNFVDPLSNFISLGTGTLPLHIARHPSLDFYLVSTITGGILNVLTPNPTDPKKLVSAGGTPYAFPEPEVDVFAPMHVEFLDDSHFVACDGLPTSRLAIFNFDVDPITSDVSITPETVVSVPAEPNTFVIIESPEP